MGAIWYRARSELDRRWRDALALALLVGLVGAVVLTVVAGARRSATAYDRSRQAARPSHVEVIVSDTDPARLDQVERLPQVEAAGRVAIPVVGPEGTDVGPGLRFLAAASPSGSFPNKVDQVRVIEGRAPDAGRADEVGIRERVAEEVLVHGFQSLKGSVTPTVIEGSAAQGPDEVVLGGETLSRLGVGLGDTVEARGTDGPVTLRIVGQGPVPFLDTDTDTDTNTVADGATITRQGSDRLATAFGYSDLELKWAPRADEGAARRRVEEQAGPVFVDKPPADVSNLGRVEVLPRGLAAFLALLALLAIGHALVVTVHRRRRDLVVLRTLGLQRHQVSAAVFWEATLLILVGLVAGVPLGVAAGRWAWTLLANGVGVVDRPEIPLAAVAIVVLAALLVTYLAVAVPAWAAARTQPALVLRTE